MSTDWKPPFCANEADELTCPACDENAVRVREKDQYYDGHEVEAYCAECHADLVVWASVDVAFSCPEVVT